ncbi:ornithine cyclodeaminase family protein [Nocardia sp. NPDC050413]|uniref:ornithine cyclodeaminase family protein n=1 Tax=Nocardia sp. NPDC050413 TaxID=3155784 RepID=UPI00340255CA
MTLILSHSDVAALIDRAEVLAAVERAHADLALGTAVVPAPPAVGVGATAFVPMVAAAESAGAAAVKLLADLPANRERGLPVQRSVILVTSALDGSCEALVDGRLVTAVRTAAASAVATKYLARQDSSTLGLIGAGALAIEHTRAVARVRDIDTVLAWSRSDATVERFRGAIADLGLEVRAMPSPESVTRAADVLCTLTPAREPIVRGAWFGEGLHVNAVGAPPRADHREVDGAAMRRARVIVDSIATTLTKSGDTLLAIADGAITEAEVSTELGQVVLGRTAGRVGPRDITLFNSVGIGLQDLVTARLLIDKARAQGRGTEVELSA